MLSTKHHQSFPGEAKYLCDIVSFTFIFIPSECEDLHQTTVTISISLFEWWWTGKPNCVLLQKSAFIAHVIKSSTHPILLISILELASTHRWGGGGDEGNRLHSHSRYLWGRGDWSWRLIRQYLACRKPKLRKQVKWQILCHSRISPLLHLGVWFNFNASNLHAIYKVKRKIVILQLRRVSASKCTENHLAAGRPNPLAQLALHPQISR